MIRCEFYERGKLIDTFNWDATPRKGEEVILLGGVYRVQHLVWVGQGGAAQPVAHVWVKGFNR